MSLRSGRGTGPRARACCTRRTGPVHTPAFIPLATKGTVRGLESHEVAALGYEMVLGNTYHLFVSPGPERIASRRRAARLHGLGAGADHRLRRLPGLLAGPRRRCQRGQGQRPPGWRPGLGGLDRGGGGALPLLPRRSRALHLARGLDAGAGGARLRHRPGLRRVHALPRRPRLHRPLDRAHPPLARSLPRVARARGAGAARRSSASSRAASTRTCGASRPRPSPPPASTGSRSAAPSAATRPRCARCWR